MNHRYYLAFASLMATLLSGATFAGESWWEKGLKLLGGQSSDETQTTAPTTAPANPEIASAFKQALQIGAENVTRRLAKTDGFNADPVIHIPLPQELQQVKQILAKFRLQGVADNLELKLNRAAEAATPAAKQLFIQSIREMTFEDVREIYQGPNDSATRYFRNKMSPQLATKMQPVISDSLSEVGAIRVYDNVMDQYKSLPFVPDVRANLTEYVTQKGMDGIFHYLAREEAAIRQDPLRHTTDLLKKVFGQQ